jgi:hypothetical protein
MAETLAWNHLQIEGWSNRFGQIEGTITESLHVGLELIAGERLEA